MVRKIQKPNLRLNLQSQEAAGSTADAAAVDSPARGYSSSPNSCLSSWEGEADVTPMVVAGCQRCLMYVMLAVAADLRCPKCRSPVIVDFFHGSTSSEKKNKRG